MKDGVQVEVIQQLMKLIRFSDIKDFEKQFALSMEVRSGLVFKKDTGELTGFCNLGEVNQDLKNLSKSLTSTATASATPALADAGVHDSTDFKPSVSFPGIVVLFCFVACEAVPSHLGSCRGIRSAWHSCIILDE